MNLLSGYPFWLIKNGLPFEYPALEKSLKTSVAIIGGGISGALAAYHLSNAGVDCVVVDARTIGLGSTCASTALLQYEIDTPLSVLIKKIGAGNAVRSYKLCETAISKLAAIAKKVKCGDYEFKKSLYYAAFKKDEKKLQEEFRTRKENGFDVRYLDTKAIKEDYGFSAPGAILSAMAAQTNAYELTHALHQYSIQKGLQIYDRTPVKHIGHGKRSVILTAENGCRITAKKLVFANGYEGIKYIDKKIAELRSTYASASEQFNSKADLWKDEALIWNTADPYLYARTTKDRRVIVGGRDELFYNTKKRDKLIEKKTLGLKQDFEKLFPDIEYKPEFNWTGTFATTTDGLPFIGSYKKIPNSYFALGFGGNGITFSLIAAEIITELIVKKKSKNAELFSFER